ncbi:MAG: AAA family ATPase [Candidatus Limnocylindrales bacterium]
MIAERVRVLVAVDSGVDLRAVEALLSEDAAMHVLGVVDGMDDGWSAVQESRPDLLVVACAGYSERALVLIDAAITQQPERPVVVLSTVANANGFIRRVFDAGADDIVSLPASPEVLRFAIEKAVARQRGAAATASVGTGSLVCVLGPKGGTGKTLTTCNLAVALAQAGRRVAVVDLDLQFGDVGLSLGLAPDRTIHELAKAGGSLDAEKLDGYLATHSSGVRVLMAPSRPDQAGMIHSELLHDVYASLRQSFDYVLVDTPPGFTPEVIATIDSASRICMVGMLDSLSLKNTKLGLETLDLMGYDRTRVLMLLNRYDSRVGISKGDVSAIIGRQPDVFVPSDREIPRQVNQGQTVMNARPRSEVAAAYRALSRRLIEAEETAPDPESRTARRRLFGKRA